MAKIARYAQDQLASSVVGTPGVDQTGGILGNALSNSADMQASAIQSSNAMMRQESDRIYLLNEAFTRQAQAQAFQGIGNEIMRRQAVQRAQDAADLAQMQAEQKAREKAQWEQINTQAASNAALEFDMKSSQVSNTLRADKTLDPSKLADAESNALMKLRDDMVKKMSPEVATKFNTHANSKISSQYEQSGKEALTAATNKLISDRKVLEHDQVGNVRSEVDFLKFANNMSEPSEVESMNRVWGPKAAERKQELLRDATKNMVNALIIDKNPEAAQEALKSGRYDAVLDDEEKKKLESAVGTALKAKEVEVRKNLKIGEGYDHVAALKVLKEVKDNPNSPQYYDNLVNGRQKLTDMLDAEYQKPVRQEGDKLTDENGKVIPYQRESYIKLLEQKRDKIDSLISSQQAEVRREAREAKAAEKEADKRNAFEYRDLTQRTLQGEQIRYNSNEAVQGRQAFRNVMNELYGIEQSIQGTLKQTKAKHLTGWEEAQLYHKATTLYAKLEDKGYLDEPGKPGVISGSYLKALDAIGAKLSADAPKVDNFNIHANIVQGMGRLHAAAPPALHKLLGEYKGRTTDDINNEYVGRMIGYYNNYINDPSNKGGKEPEPSTIDHFRKMAADKMKLDALGVPTHGR